MSDSWDIIGATVEKIIARSKHKHVFSYFTEEDIEQEIKTIALEAYQKYKPSRGPLENFLAHSISNRLRNLKRNNDYIVQTPCVSYKCEFYCKKDKSCRWDKTKCIDWAKYIKTYSSKTAVINPGFYPDEDMITCTTDSIGGQLEEMLNIAAKRSLPCYSALKDFINCRTEIPDEHKMEIQDLAIEVAR